MDDNERTYKLNIVWAIVISIFILSITAYNITDRLGPQRTIVTTTQSYQAK